MRSDRTDVRSERVAAAIFARAPRPGFTKTRLARAIGDARAAALSEAFLADVRRTVASVPSLDAELWAASEEDAAILGCARVQSSGDLGARMRAAIEHGLKTHGAAIVIGSDAPTLPASALRSAADALSKHDAVLGPSADGGYYLLGARVPLPPLERVRWSTRWARRDTLAALGAMRVAQLAPWYDVDTEDDLRLLRAHLALRPSAAPTTARLLDIKP